jgi:type VI secretion system secreted protein VgrG
MQEEEAKIAVFTGVSTCRAFSSGQRFQLKDYYRSDMNDKQYVLTGIVHEASQSLGLAGETEDVFRYQNEFTCIPHDVPFRPPRETRRPIVQGTQTAIVVGPSGEEIYTDKHGRIKVQFHWDRDGKKDENSSCWVRVGQLWAGSGWGAVYIPRIGQEVIVDFLEGDPDHPIVIGCVYHGNNKPPYPLPDEKTKSAIKSEATVGGGGFNEIRFEDKKGKEELFLRAEKDMNVVVLEKLKGDAREEITLVCGKSKIVMKKDGTITITGMQIKVEGSTKVEVLSDAQVNIKGLRTKLEGTTMLDLQASGVATLKGSLTKIG